MLMSDFKLRKPMVRFISYTGKYPNLCSGVLTLEIAGCEYRFGGGEYDFVTSFPRFWYSTGTPYIEGKGGIRGEWMIDVDLIPYQLRVYAYDIDRVFNENVEHGCCGGCA